MAQGYTIDATADTITFLEPPPTGTNNIVVVERAIPATGGATDVFALSAWGPRYGYPSDVEFFGDRLWFSGSPAQPQTLWLSKIGNYTDFGKTIPSVDDDAITATINARQVNAIKDMVPLDKMILLTAGGEWKTGGGQDDVLTPTTISFKPQSYNGASDVPALVIGNTALFVQNRGYIARDLGYQFESDGYTGNDLTVFAAHLTEGKPIVAWDYQQIPYSVVWSVRDDGVLLALTYMKDQSVIAWTPMEVDGFVESLTVIPEGDQDAVYLLVRREVEGVQRRYIERLAPRIIDDVREGRFLDSHLTYDGRNTTATTLTAGTPFLTFLVGATLTVTASSATFSAGDIGDVIVLGYGAGANARLTITGFTSSTVVTAVIDTPVPASLRAVAVTDWGIARDVISGLDHLEGREVGILADGFVQDPRVVSGGQITLDAENKGVLVHVGLPYTSDFETLEINVPGAASTRLQYKAIKRVGLILQDSRGMEVGASFDKLDEVEPRSPDDSTIAPPALRQGTVEEWITSSWASTGKVCVRQSQPLPLSILGVVPDVSMGQT